MPSATAYLTSDVGVTGTITFTQAVPDGIVNISVDINEGITSGFHALHINTFGDISKGRNTTGAVFNPTNGMNPIGELKPINAGNGFAQEDKISEKISLFDGKNSIIGRAIVVYANKNPTSEAIALGVIGRAP